MFSGTDTQPLGKDTETSHRRELVVNYVKRPLVSILHFVLHLLSLLRLQSVGLEKFWPNLLLARHCWRRKLLLRLQRRHSQR